MKKTVVFCLSFVLLITFAMARGEPSISFLCEVIPQSIPDNCKYIDMLIPISKQDSIYTEYNVENGHQTGIAEQSEIVAYDEAGFRSYTFHGNMSQSRITPQIIDCGETYIEFYIDENTTYKSDNFGKKYRKAKFAYIDANGNILSVTDPIDIWQDFGYTDIFITIEGESVTSVMTEGLLHELVGDLQMLLVVSLVILIVPIIVITFKRLIKSKKLFGYCK